MGRSYPATVVRSGGGRVCEQCAVAQTPLTRLKGLLGRARLRPDEGLLIRPTGAIHTCFMRFPIDAVFLTRDLVVVDVVSELRPWRFAGRRGAKAVLELGAGEGRRRGIQVGDRLSLADPGAAS